MSYTTEAGVYTQGAGATAAAVPGSVLTGTIASFRDGWGLIESPSLPNKLYCGLKDNPVLQTIQPTPGLEVQFELGTNPKDGREKAINAQVLVRDFATCIGQRVRGTVKRVQGSFCIAGSDQYSGDVLLGTRSIAAAGVGSLSLGDLVEFEVAAQAKAGRYEGVNIQVLGRAAPQAAAQMQVPVAYAGNGNARDRSRTPRPAGHVITINALPPAVRPASAAQANVAAVAISQGHLVGTVKTFRDHWGFIVSDQVQGDVYVSLRDNPQLGAQLSPGEAVQFDLDFRGSADRNNGTRAMNVQRLGMAPAVQVQPMQMAARPAPMAMVQQPAVKPGHAQQHTGKLMMMKDGWGWLEASTLSGQVFFGLKDNSHLATPPNVGDMLTFEVVPGAKGREKAVNVQPSFVGQRLRGTVSGLKEGWGFAVCEGITGKIMLGKKNLTASGLEAAHLQVGEALEFDLAMGPKGYEAANIIKVA